MHSLFLAYPKCGEDQFTCGNFRCIDESMKCNGVDNCRDGVRSDEQNCRKFEPAWALSRLVL